MAKRIVVEKYARRLAKAIAADLRIYNEEAIASGADLSSEVAEGRAHFEKRVSESFYGLFDEVLADVAPSVRYDKRGAASQGVAADAGTAADRFGSFYKDDKGRADREMDAAGGPREEAAGGASRALSFIIVAVLLAAVVAYVLAR